MVFIACIKSEIALLPRVQDIGTHSKGDVLELFLECLSLSLLILVTEEAFNRVLANMMRRISLLLSNVER